MRTAAIKAIACHLPELVLSNDDLAKIYPDWTAEKILDKIGIFQRHIAAPDETAADLACAAAEKLFRTHNLDRSSIDFILFCSQSPDYILPTTACILQDRLGLSQHTGALDYNLGCSGFVYGLALAKGLIETNAANRVLILTADTYSKFINPSDKSVRTLFGDGAAATLVEAVESPQEMIGPFVFGTNGAGASDLMVPAGGARLQKSAKTAIESTDASGNVRSLDNLHMNGSEIMAFTLGAVPDAIEALLNKSGKSIDEYNLYVFHQASKFILDKLRKKMSLDADKYVVNMKMYGNTVSSSIPFALDSHMGSCDSPRLAMLVGFGVGLSWAATNVII
jgi:3-oxoacyl-[acyl-carrier-protein] synthase-3